MYIMSHKDGEWSRGDAPGGGFLDKRSKVVPARGNSFSVPPRRKGFELLLDTTGSRKCEADAAFPSESSQSKHGNTGEA